MYLIAEFIDYMDAYRLHNPEYPHQTVAYTNDLKCSELHAKENGYYGIILYVDYYKKYNIIKITK